MKLIRIMLKEQNWEIWYAYCPYCQLGFSSDIKVPQLGSARKFHSSGSLELENSSSNPSLQFDHSFLFELLMSIMKFSPVPNLMHHPLCWATPMPFASINLINPRTNLWNFREIILRIGNFEKLNFFESVILNFFFSKEFFSASSPWKLVPIYMVEWMGRILMFPENSLLCVISSYTV